MHVQSGCSGNDSDVVIPSLPSSGSQPMDEHRVWFQRFGTTSLVQLPKVDIEKYHDRSPSNTSLATL